MERINPPILATVTAELDELKSECIKVGAMHSACLTERDALKTRLETTEGEYFMARAMVDELKVEVERLQTIYSD
jgi:hypothetical protein